MWCVVGVCVFKFLILLKFNKKIELKIKSIEDLEGILKELRIEISFILSLFNEFILFFGRYKDIKNLLYFFYKLLIYFY